MIRIVVVDGTYAALYGDTVVGVVERCPYSGDGMWGFYPLSDGNQTALWPVTLHHALEAAQKFGPK